MPPCPARPSCCGRPKGALPAKPSLGGEVGPLLDRWMTAWEVWVATRPLPDPRASERREGRGCPYGVRSTEAPLHLRTV
jgi:hypothetical protein